MWPKLSFGAQHEYHTSLFTAAHRLPSVPVANPTGFSPVRIPSGRVLLQESVGLKGLSSLSCTMQCARGQVLE